MEKVLLLTAALLMGTSVWAQAEPDPTKTAKYWVDLYRKKNELKDSYMEQGSKAALEIQKIDKLLDTDELDEKLEKLQDRKDECEESFDCSDEEMTRLYKEMRELNKQQDLISAAEDFVDVEDDKKVWEKRSKQMNISENQRQKLIEVLDRRVELKANKLQALEGKKTATARELEEWDDEFEILTDALYKFDIAQSQGEEETPVKAEAYNMDRKISYLKSICISYIEKYKNDPKKKQFVERVQEELNHLNSEYPDVKAADKVENPENKFHFGLDGQGRIISINML